MLNIKIFYNYGVDECVTCLNGYTDKYAMTADSEWLYLMLLVCVGKEKTACEYGPG